MERRGGKKTEGIKRKNARQGKKQGKRIENESSRGNKEIKREERRWKERNGGHEMKAGEEMRE